MEITLTFDKPFNSSLQVGDTIWYTKTQSSGGFNIAPKEYVEKLGTVEFINHQYRAHILKVSKYHVVNQVPSIPINTNTFIMFSKNDVANLGDVKGYFAEVRLENDSTEKVELFAVSSEINKSSK
tara:strand:- start:937 stop:1311 length:375 start_codon:yes stop_codon:yes gene_type:complete